MRWKTRAVTISVHARNGDVTNRAWRISRSQEQQIMDFLGKPELESVVPADGMATLTAAVEEIGVPILEPSRDTEAEALDDVVGSGLRSLVGTITPQGNVQMMIIYGTTSGEGQQTVAMIPNAMVVIKSEEFGRWLDGMKDWWLANK